MVLIDTHTHLYLGEFDGDRHEMIGRAIVAGISNMLLPNIDSSTIQSMLDLCREFSSNCFPMMGLHPTSVKENYTKELDLVDQWLESDKFCAIGETGMDLYWDKTFQREQEIAFVHQINLAKKHNLPVVIHSRNSFDEIFNILKTNAGSNLRGVFHCFSGNLDQAEKIIELGFLLGIGGVVTFKNSGLDKVIDEINLDHIILETDAPFIAPAPHRGKRNESAYLRIIAEKIGEIKNLSLNRVAQITSANAARLFKLKVNE